MKTITHYLLAFLMISTSMFAQNGDGISRDDKKRAVNSLEKAKEETLDLVEGLSKEQLSFKPSEDSWSIAECVEHLAITEEMMLDMIAKTLEQEGDPAKKAQIKDDKDIYGMITDRSQKVKTSEPMEPSNKYGSFKDTRKAFAKNRSATVKYLEKTDANLRNHFQDMPFGPVDAYQLFLFDAGHNIRHNEQIKEIMAHSEYPAK
ncbi:DinB family protein [Robertkochia aurantiaca]|uniref:DinB family protein n=1 Tax=Robertkochia aurantiaca TaxID=2873700 RepID=UPI001CC93E9B|nr:DinB family protein [Robertkochia sp. 3YJGBD-33]